MKVKGARYIAMSNCWWEGSVFFFPPENSSLVAGSCQYEWGQLEAQDELFIPRQVPGKSAHQYENFQIVSSSCLKNTTGNTSTAPSAAKARWGIQTCTFPRSSKISQTGVDEAQVGGWTLILSKRQ